ncbi:MAG: Cell division protein FtsI, partial [Myxococcaceae bacterium]|nr:Cell division protein FtsI [Myxococcaceae bacterium]
PPPNAAPPPDQARVPDANGMAARDAVRAISAVGLVPQVEGSGRLVKQNPPAGTIAPKGSAVRLVLEPAS